MESDKVDDIKLSTLLRLCAVLDVTPDAILGFDGGHVAARQALDSVVVGEKCVER